VCAIRVTVAQLVPTSMNVPTEQIRVMQMHFAQTLLVRTIVHATLVTLATVFLVSTLMSVPSKHTLAEPTEFAATRRVRILARATAVSPVMVGVVWISTNVWAQTVATQMLIAPTRSVPTIVHAIIFGWVMGTLVQMSMSARLANTVVTPMRLAPTLMVRTLAPATLVLPAIVLPAMR